MRYENEVSRRVKDALEKIKKYKTTNEDVKLVKSIFPKMEVWIDHEVNCSFKVNSMDEVKSVLKKFAEHGIMLENFNKSETSPVWYLKGRKVIIRLQPIWPEENQQGATCRLVQVGVETCTYPKYKLVCDGKEEEDEIA
jgi:hypothetical protein